VKPFFLTLEILDGDQDGWSVWAGDVASGTLISAGHATHKEAEEAGLKWVFDTIGPGHLVRTHVHGSNYLN
jgi:hypothetical protein